MTKYWKDEAKRLLTLEDEFGFLPIAANSKKPLIHWKDHHGLSINKCLSFSSCAAIAVLTGLDLLCLDFDSEKGLDFFAENQIDFTQSTWHVNRSDGSKRFKAFYRPSVLQKARLPLGEFHCINVKNLGLDIFLSHKRYAIVIGSHPQGGEYIWCEGYGPDQLAEPSTKLWDFVIEQSNQNKVITTTTSRSDEWERLSYCPICGRDDRPICSQHRDRRTIRCFQGQTFCAPLDLRRGERFDQTWAYASEQDVDGIGRFSIFVKDSNNKKYSKTVSMLRRYNRGN